GERVVVVPGGGVPRTGKLDELGVGHLGQEVLHRFFTHHIGQFASNQQDRNGQLDRGLLELFDAHERVFVRFGQERRVPVPVPAAVAVAQVLLQSLGTARLRPVRQVGG